MDIIVNHDSTNVFVSINNFYVVLSKRKECFFECIKIDMKMFIINANFIKNSSKKIDPKIFRGLKRRFIDSIVTFLLVYFEKRLNITPNFSRKLTWYRVRVVMNILVSGIGLK